MGVFFPSSYYPLLMKIIFQESLLTEFLSNDIGRNNIHFLSILYLLMAVKMIFRGIYSLNNFDDGQYSFLTITVFNLYPPKQFLILTFFYSLLAIRYTVEGNQTLLNSYFLGFIFSNIMSRICYVKKIYTKLKSRYPSNKTQPQRKI